MHSNKYLTHSEDTEKYLLYFFDIESMLQYSSVSKSLNVFIKKYTIYEKIVTYKNIPEKNDKQNMLIWASKNGHIETVKYLVSLGADIRALNDYSVVCASSNGPHRGLGARVRTLRSEHCCAE